MNHPVHHRYLRLLRASFVHRYLPLVRVPFLIPLFLVACHKTTSSTPTPAYTVTAAINGVPTSFNAIINVDSTSTPGTVYIVAHADSANLTPLLEVTLTSSSSSAALKAGTYYFADTTGGNSAVVGFTTWQNDTAIQYFGISDTVALNTVNKIWLSGTFQGTCQYTADSTVSVSNGQFTVGWNEQ
jgi:hypothetical protein